MRRTKSFGGVPYLFDETNTPRRLKKRQKVRFRCIGSGFVMGNPLARPNRVAP